MITAAGRDERNQPLLYLTLDPVNLARLQAGQPIRLDAERTKAMGLPAVTLVIAYEKDLSKAAQRIQRHNPDVRVVKDQ